MYQTMKTVSPDDVLKTLAAQRESDEPDTILDILKQHDGKRLTVRLLDKLPGGPDRWRITHSASMTYIQEHKYGRTGGREGYCFFMAYATTSVVIDVKYIEEKNTCYFSARRERNAKRDAILNDKVNKTQIAMSISVRINAVLHARMMLADALRGLGEYTAHGEMLSPDQYVWEALAGAEK